MARYAIGSYCGPKEHLGLLDLAADPSSANGGKNSNRAGSIASLPASMSEATNSSRRISNAKDLAGNPFAATESSKLGDDDEQEIETFAGKLMSSVSSFATNHPQLLGSIMGLVMGILVFFILSKTHGLSAEGARNLLGQARSYTFGDKAIQVAAVGAGGLSAYNNSRAIIGGVNLINKHSKTNQTQGMQQSTQEAPSPILCNAIRLAATAIAVQSTYNNPIGKIAFETGCIIRNFLGQHAVNPAVTQGLRQMNEYAATGENKATLQDFNKSFQRGIFFAQMGAAVYVQSSLITTLLGILGSGCSALITGGSTGLGSLIAGIAALPYAVPILGASAAAWVAYKFFG